MADTVVLVAFLLALAVVVAGVFRRLPIPDSVVLVLAGMALAELARRWPGAGHAADLELSPDLVFFVLLPVLVFESGLNLDTRRLLRNLAPVVTLAVPALLLATALVGAGLWLAAGMEPLVALLFGALIAATDPVAVVALFREVGAPPRLAVLVEGESLFNDATAIVVFGLVLALAVAGGPVGAATIADACVRFVVVFAGGALFGVVTAALASEITHRLGSPTPAMLAMSVATAYGSFTIAEHGLHVSGVMATVGASLTFGALAVTRLTRDAAGVLRETWETLAFACNALLFLLVGLAVDVGSLAARWPEILIAVLLVHAARAASVYGLLPVTLRLFRLPAFASAERHIMWWGGLKGGLALAMALSIPETLAERALVLDLTVGVVLFTLLVNASTLRPLMHRVGLDRLRADERAQLEEALADARLRVEERLDRLRGVGALSSSGHHRLVRGAMHALAPPRSVAASAARAARLVALRAEAAVLGDLYECRAIDQYTFLEMRDLLVRDRESAPAHTARGAGEAANVFRRAEAGGLRWLRERDWAAGLLSRFQRLRLTEHLQRNLAGLLMAEAALHALDAHGQDHDGRVREPLRDTYRERAERRRERLASARREFPALYSAFEQHALRNAALRAALLEADRDAQRGQLGAKAQAEVSRRIHLALRASADAADGGGAATPRALLAAVPLLRGLSDPGLDALAAEAHPLTFLPGDVIIGEGEHGDAMYVISRGRVAVSRADAQAPLAVLGDGEIFGEAALLGDPVRNATVTATAPSILLRVTRGQALAVAERWPELGERLRKVDAARH